MPDTPHIESLQVSLDHFAKALGELKEEQRQTRDAIVQLRVGLATVSGSGAERNKIGDWLMSAVISLLTSFGMAKLLIGSSTHK